MSIICIKDYNFDLNNIIIIKSENDNYKEFNVKYIYYKYDLNFSKELIIVTQYINIDYLSTKFDNLIIKTSDEILVNIFNKLQETINKTKDYNIITIDTETSISDSEYLSNSDNSDNLNSDKKSISLKFVNNKTKLTLYPSKKSGLEKYTLKDNLDVDKITKYFPYIQKKNCLHSGKFIIKVKSYFNQIIFQIMNGKIKYKLSYIENDLKCENVYEQNITIDI